MNRSLFNTQILKILCIFGLLLVHLNSFSSNIDIKIISGYKIDLADEISIRNAPEQIYTAMPDNLASLGFVKHPIWVKLNFTSPHASNPYKFLVLNPARHDQVNLYQVSKNTPFHSKIESLPSIEKVSFFGESQKNIFLLGNISEEADYFLEIQPYGPMNILLALKNAEDLEADFHGKLFSLGGAVFSTFIFLLLICFLYHISREMIYIHFFLHVLATVLVFISTLGFGVSFLTDKLGWDLNHQTGFFMILNVSSSLLLFGNILKLLRLPSWLSKYIYFIPAANLIFLLWFISTGMQNAWLLSCAYGAVFCFIYGFSFLRFFDRGVPAQWALALFSSLIYFFLMLVLLALLGFLPLTKQALQVNNLRIGFLPIIFGLIFWFYEVIKRNRITEIEIEKTADTRNLEIEIQRRKTYEGFMGMLVHEIKTPLSIIQIASISLGRRFTSPSNEALRVAHIDKSVNDINDILYKCVQVSDIENNSVFVDKSHIEIDELIHELRTHLKSDRIQWDSKPGQQVFTDYMLLRTILNNLLSNAIKYAKKETPILFFCHAMSVGERSLLRFSVTNEIGQAGAPDPKMVFERYYRGSNTSSLPGTGLGLWLSQSIARTIETEIQMNIYENRISFSIEVEAA